MKTCSNCKVEKADTDFHPSTSRGTLQSWCKKCKAIDYINKKEDNRKKRKEWYQKNKSEISIKGKVKRKDPLFNTDLNIKRRCRFYGITTEQYHNKLLENSNCCEICQKSFISTPAIDHDHSTYDFRSLLCDNCNTALGLLKESQTILQSMIKYLIKYKK